MTRGGPSPIWCRNEECGIRIIFARRAGTTKRVPFEYADQTPFSDASAGCLVIVAGEAWRPIDLIEDFQTRFEIGEESARELVSGYPWHRPHFHEPSEGRAEEGTEQ